MERQGLLICLAQSMAWTINSIPDKTKGEMYKALANKSYAQVAVDFKIDIHYKDATGYRNAVYRIAKEVEASPEKYGVTPEVVEIVKVSAEERKSRGNQPLAEMNDSAILDFTDTKAVTLGGRNKAAELLHKKMDMINGSRRLLEKENLVSLAKVFGIFFDKAQILQGQATENIAIKAKITKDMSPDEALDQLLNMREQRQVDQYD